MLSKGFLIKENKDQIPNDQTHTLVYNVHRIGKSHERVNLKGVDGNIDGEMRKDEKWSSHQQVM